VKKEKQTTRAFYRHAETGQLIVIERQADGTILGSCPVSEPLKALVSYECKADNNLWVQENSHKLVLYEAGR